MAARVRLHFAGPAGLGSSMRTVRTGISRYRRTWAYRRLQLLDADRCDYLLRDSHATGTNYGDFDLTWMLAQLRPDPTGRRFYLTRKGIAAAETYLFARFHMYRTVYFHKTSRAAEVMLKLLLSGSTSRSTPACRPAPPRPAPGVLRPYRPAHLSGGRRSHHHRDDEDVAAAADPVLGGGWPTGCSPAGLYKRLTRPALAGGRGRRAARRNCAVRQGRRTSASTSRSLH
ncbi:MAG: hypothetical protein U0736_18165 [Gemmataceae bacterium]